MQSLLSAIDNFPWPLATTVIALAAMIIFRREIGDVITRSHEFKTGRVSLKAKPPGPTAREIKQILSEVEGGDGLLDAQRLVIRDSSGRPRMLAATVESGEPFLTLIDEDSRPRATLVAASATDPDGLAMLFFHGESAGDTASFIGAERDGSGAVGIRDSSGIWKEMS
jgi:hypothetical protein